MPSTTPASQAGLLHGSNDGIPAFRWYEKDTGRLMVANRPEDAALIESRLSNGRGLLAEGGVSVSTMFSGDAPTALMVMSRVTRGGDLGPGSSYVRFFSSPFVLARALVRTVAEMVKEIHQGRQQRVRQILPRVHRRGSYVALRGLTNAVLRDLNVARVAEHLMAGAPVIFVNFVDYDEARGPLAMGPSGIRVLLENVVEGGDPLAGFGPRAAADLARVATMDVAPDLLVHSTLHPRTGEVHAFEELVGSHGGLGGGQNQAVLVHPADWTVDDDLLDRSVEGEELLYGADMVHRQLVRWLERCGAQGREEDG